MSAFMTSLADTLLAVGPALLLGLVLAGVLHVLVPGDRILAHVGRPGLASSVKAALVGVPMPLCSCGVLPAALGMRRDGASRGAVTSFLISTPQTGVDSISVTWAMLGWPVALAKVIAAFAGGVLGGVLADRVPDGAGSGRVPPACADTDGGSLLRRVWNYSFGTIFRDIHRWLLLGILVSAAMGAFVAPGSLSEYPALNGPLGMLAALAVGIPLYVCSTASVPIAAGLIHAGFPVGSALVFLMAGPATNAATMGAVRKALGGRVFAVYLGTVTVVSLVAGLILNTLDVSPPAAVHVHGADGAPLTATASAALLTAGIAWFLLLDAASWLGKRRAVSPGSRRDLLLRVEGMSCQRCEARVRGALEALPGVLEVAVSAREGTVLLRTSEEAGIPRGAVVEAVEALGYRVGEEGS